MTTDADENATTVLLRLAGPRTEVPRVRAAHVRTAVYAEWRRRSHRRAVRRRAILGLGLLASAAGVVYIVASSALLNQSTLEPGPPTAIVEEVVGTPRYVSGRGARLSAPALALNAKVRIGEWIETDAQSRVGLRFSSGTSVRLDSGSRIRPLSPTAIELTAGAVYVDTGDESGRFEVQTPFATAHDLGTQFEVRLIAKTVRLRVRTGVVELRDATRSVSGRAGTEIALSETGAVSRPVATHGAEWDWITGLVSLPEMEGMSLASFLERLAHEQGLAVHYADPTLAREATGIVLHGSVRDLAPEQAIETAIATSGLHHRLEDRTLFVLRAPNGK